MARLVAAERAAHGGSGFAALTVVYAADARQAMLRPLTFDQFCVRCERQGRSQWQYSQLHDDATVAAWCGVNGAEARWQEMRGELPARVARVHGLEAQFEAAPADARAALRAELHAQYWWTFDAFKTKGIVEAAGRA